MDDIKINMIPIKDLKSPTVLYKYRDWNDDFHKKLIIEPSVYLSAPSDFDDPLDCKNSVRYDLLKDFEIFDKYFHDSKKYNIAFDFFQHFRWAGEHFLNCPLRDPYQRLEVEIETAKEFNGRFGVLSLTADSLNTEMWRKYANDFKGFCIGYNSKLLFDFLGGGSKVNYTDDLPIIKPFEDFMIQHYKQVFYKKTKWSFEKEYRTHKTWLYRVTKSERNIKIASKCINNVIFGPLISKEHKLEIENYVKSNMPHVLILNTELEGNKIKFCT